MPIDTSIYGLIGRGVKSVADYDNEYAQVQQNKLANLMNGAKLDEYKRGVEDQNALRTALSSGVDPYNALMQRGNVKGATDYAKAQADVKKTGADAEESVAKTAKIKLEASNLALTQHRAMLNNVNDPDTAKQWLVAAYQNPDTKFIFERFGSMDEALRRFDQSVRDPASFAKWKMGASMNADELVKYTTPDANAKLQSDTSIKTTGMNNATSRANNQATVGASYANAAATREIAKATRDAAQIKGNQDTEMKLGDDYRAQSKNFKETADAYKQINAVLDKATTSPAATLAGATKFMKMIDPGSVVRESELGMALAATGVFDRATNYFNTLSSGKVLTANQVKDFKAITKQINDAAAQQQGLIDQHYSKVAKQYGLRPEMVVQDFGQNPGAAPGGDLLNRADAILRGGK